MRTLKIPLRHSSFNFSLIWRLSCDGVLYICQQCKRIKVEFNVLDERKRRMQIGANTPHLDISADGNYERASGKRPQEPHTWRFSSKAVSAWELACHQSSYQLSDTSDGTVSAIPIVMMISRLSVCTRRLIWWFIYVEGHLEQRLV